MKFTIAALLVSLSAVLAMPEISVNSAQGKSLLSKARRLDENQNQNQQQEEYDFEVEFAWLTGYSLKFQGCHHIKQWNDEADGDEDVRIQTKRLIRFRLCPADTCTTTKAAGCNSAYGDYIIDMETFMESYMEGKANQIEYDCQYHMMYNCDCDNDDNKGDDFNEEYCEYDCYNDAGMAQCIENNPYQDEQDEQQFDPEEYMVCNKINPENGRRLEEEDVQYYVGPYCSEQGGAVKLGLFTDETCTIEAEGVTFKELMGFDLPYSGEDDNIIDYECMGCIEKEDPEKEAENQNNGNGNGDQYDADQINEMCEMIYSSAGKCESNYPEGMVYNANNNACNYMEGIRITRQDGIIDTGSSRPSAVATSFIVVFAMAFAAMAFYVWYLRTRLGVKKNTLL